MTPVLALRGKALEYQGTLKSIFVLDVDCLVGAVLKVDQMRSDRLQLLPLLSFLHVGVHDLEGFEAGAKGHNCTQTTFS